MSGESPGVWAILVGASGQVFRDGFFEKVTFQLRQDDKRSYHQPSAHNPLNKGNTIKIM